MIELGDHKISIPLSRATVQYIISELEETEWGEILNSDDVNFSYETFVNKLTDIYSKNCPDATGKVNDLINHG